MVQNTYVLRLIFLFSALFFSCNQIPEKPWTEAIPHNTAGVITFSEGTTVGTVLDKSYTSFLDDITPSAIPIIESVINAGNGPLQVRALGIYPSLSTDWYPVWYISLPPEELSSIAQNFTQPFFENSYGFEGVEIHKLTIRDRILFAAQLGEFAMISESSFAVEQGIRSYLGQEKPMDLPETGLVENKLYLNGDGMDDFAAQLGAIKLRPLVEDSFMGLGVGPLNFERIEDEENEKDLLISGWQNVDKDSSSALVRALSGTPAEVTLDRYISSDAAAFSVMHALPATKPSADEVTSRMDSLLAADEAIYNEIYNILLPEFAFVAYPSSSFAGFGEYLFIRKIEDSRAFYRIMERLADEGFVSELNDTYYVNSPLFSDMLGGGISDFSSFYLATTGDAVVISPRLGLSQRIRADRSRRRVIYYNNTYSGMKSGFAENVSTLFFAESEPFRAFLSNKIYDESEISTITNQFELVMGTSVYNADEGRIQWDISTYKTEKSTLPYEEQWISPLDGGEITGVPVLADIGGSRDDEVLVATTRGSVYGIAGDGTVLFQTEMEVGDVPVGSPVAFDWYGNNQTAILVGASNKIYAWNTNGDLLPQFPFNLDEPLTASITIADVTRNGISEIIAVTNDRNVHVLNGRGENIEGFPVMTNAISEHQPRFLQVNGNWAVQAVAENGLFMWDSKGRLMDGFPLFLAASVSSELVRYEDALFMGANDGHLYSISKNRVFADSLNVLAETPLDTLTSDLKVGALYVSNSPVSGLVVQERIRTELDSVTVYNSDAFIAQTASGNVVGISKQGRLLFEKSMGQPSAENHKPFVADLHQDGSPEVLSVAGFGRLYAWEIYDGDRFFQIPTSSVQYPIITDLEGDGNPELIAQTRSGLRCWTIYKTD